MYQEIDLREISYIATSLAHYKGLIHYVMQLDPKQRTTLELFWLEVLKDKKYFDQEIKAKWNDVNFHFIRQDWGSTSCGWGGIGGAAMSASYTLVVENLHYKFASIYYSGQLAYIVKMDENFELFQKGGYKNLPGLDGLRGTLTVIYQNRNKR